VCQQHQGSSFRGRHAVSVEATGSNHQTSGAAVVDAVAEVADRFSSIGAQRRDVDDDQVPSSTRRKEALMRLWTVHWVCGSGRPVPDPDVPGVPPPPFAGRQERLEDHAANLKRT
jgi:hypothetical protein